MKRRETGAGERGGNSKTENVEGNGRGKYGGEKGRKRERKGKGNGERNLGFMLRRENRGWKRYTEKRQGKGGGKRCSAKV